MIKEAENIILNKEYFELSADELATVSELVQNAEEFDEMKWFLASTQGMVAQEKITATPELKQKVMDHLNQSESKRKFWLNGVIPFMLPEHKKFYQKPAFQMGMAALVVAGIFLFMPDNMKQYSVAMNERVEEFKEFEDATDTVEQQFELAEEDVGINGLTPEVEYRNLDFEKSNEATLFENSEIIVEVEEVATVNPDADGYFEGGRSVAIRRTARATIVHSQSH